MGSCGQVRWVCEVVFRLERGMIERFYVFYLIENKFKKSM